MTAASAQAHRPRDRDDVLHGIDRVTASLLASKQALRLSMPDVAAEVLRLVQDEKTEAAQLERVIARDIFVSAQLIAIANSAMFAPRTPILTVREAVVRIGMKAVRDIVVMVVSSSHMFRLPGLEMEGTVLRHRALASAVASRLIAQLIGAQADYAFLAGLLHDIGSLVLLQECLHTRALDAAMMSDPLLRPAIEECLHAHHQTVGAFVCQSWKLPSGVVDAAACHHNWMHDGRHHVASNIAGLSDRVVDELGIGQPGKPLDATEPVVMDLRISAENLPPLVEKTREQFYALARG